MSSAIGYTLSSSLDSRGGKSLSLNGTKGKAETFPVGPWTAFDMQPHSAHAEISRKLCGLSKELLSSPLASFVNSEGFAQSNNVGLGEFCKLEAAIRKTQSLAFASLIALSISVASPVEAMASESLPSTLPGCSTSYCMPIDVGAAASNTNQLVSLHKPADSESRNQQVSVSEGMGVVPKSTSSFDTGDLQSKLEAQIKLDFKADMEAKSLKNASNLLEMAEHFEEIDSKVPSDVSGMDYTINHSSAPLVGNPDIMAASFPGGMALSGGATAAINIIAPSVVSTPLSGLSARLGTILAEGIQHFIGGGFAGAVGASVVYPLDTIKTKMQAQRKGEDGSEVEYENEIDCVMKMVRKEGIISLYSGIGPQLLGIAPEKAMKLTVNEILLQVLEAFLPGTRIWLLEIVAGGGGGLSQVLFTNPVETVKVKLQTQVHVEGETPKNPIQVAQELGLKGLYYGSLATVAREVPGSSVFFACYTLMKQAYPDQFFLDGCLAAIPAAYICTPADVIKTRLTIDPPPGEEPYKGALDCVKRVVAKEGVGALFNGGFTRVLRIGPQFGITLMIYDMLYHH